jgi:hypothetical protein
MAPPPGEIRIETFLLDAGELPPHPVRLLAPLDKLAVVGLLGHTQTGLESMWEASMGTPIEVTIEYCTS